MRITTQKNPRKISINYTYFHYPMKILKNYMQYCVHIVWLVTIIYSIVQLYVSPAILIFVDECTLEDIHLNSNVFATIKTSSLAN